MRQTSHNTPEAIEPDLAWADAVLMWSWPAFSPTLLARCPRLTFAGHINISRSSAEAELARGLAVSEARHGWSEAVADRAAVGGIPGAVPGDAARV